MAELGEQHARIDQELWEAVRTVVDSSSFIGGKWVETFEDDFARSQESADFVSCGNGTDALFIALKALGVGPGDEVVTTAHSWFSTAEVISLCGASPVFVDVDDYFHLNPDALEDAVNERTKAIIGVHLFGQVFDAPAVASFAQRAGVALIEDSAQAHGASLDQRPVGSWGMAATFSFFPGKNLGAWGDAGGIATNDLDFASECRRFARHGGLKKHEHQIPGLNSRLDAIQAAVLRVKLPYLKAWNARREVIASMYRDRLAHIPQIELPLVRSGARHVWHQFAILVDDRMQLRAFLEDRGVETAIHYPRALPFTPAYEHLGYGPESLPRAWSNQRRILSLPIYPEMTDDQAEYVVECLLTHYGP